VNGNFKAPNYKEISINDPNLTMNFDGLLDLTIKKINMIFILMLKMPNQLNLVKILSFKGDVVQVSGNSIENLQGNVYIKETSYQNNKDT
jgi:hypothetical protein